MSVSVQPGAKMPVRQVGYCGTNQMPFVLHTLSLIMSRHSQTVVHMPLSCCSVKTGSYAPWGIRADCRDNTFGLDSYKQIHGNLSST